MTLENQLRGFKATLSNPNVSDDAKQHAESEIARIEKELGVESGSYDNTTTNSGSTTTGGDEHSHRVAGGYKATLNNPNVSDEAKQHARDVLESGNIEESSRSTGGETGDEHTNRVLGGYKATLNNPNTSEEAKERAQHTLESGDIDAGRGGATGDEHQNRVLGGYKATLNNPNVGEDAKEHAREVLGEAGVSA